MKKDGKSRFGRNIIFSMAAVFAAGFLLTGCQGRNYEKYERIRPEGDTQGAADSGQAEIRIGDGTDGADHGIVIEPEAEPEPEMEPGTADLAGAGDGGAGGSTLLFGGDVLLSGHVLNAYQKAGGIHGVLDEGCRSVIQDADFFMVNEEFPFSNRGTQAEEKEYTFRLEPERVSMFREMGIDAVTLANNHALDFGEEALLDSIATLDGAGILHTGAGAELAEARKPVEAELGGWQIAIIGATRVMPESSWAAGKNHAGMLSSYDAAALLEEVRAQKEAGKFVIVYVHWGVEKDEKPQEYQRNLGRQYIDAGADLVIGSHPHVLQGIEYYKGKPIVYSLGNFVFGSSIPRTALLEVKLKNGGETPEGGEMPEGGENGTPGQPGADSAVRLRLIPGVSGAGYTRMLTDPAKLREFYRYMESISAGVSFAEDGTVIPGQWSETGM